jgi:hypothetical protein
MKTTNEVSITVSAGGVVAYVPADDVKATQAGFRLPERVAPQLRDLDRAIRREKGPKTRLRAEVPIPILNLSDYPT